MVNPGNSIEKGSMTFCD